MGVVWAMTLPGLVCLLVAVSFAEVIVNRMTGGRMTGGRFLPWTRRRGSRTVAPTGSMPTPHPE
ncbi:hypothetical protein AB0M34_12595 [Nocardia sp. NPDC050193]